MAAPKVVQINPENVRLSDFELFWEVYPNKKAKLDALKAWNQTRDARPDIEKIIGAIEYAVQSGQWRDTQYIPHPAKWLRAGQWDDE